MIQTDAVHRFLSETKNRANKVYWNYLNSQTNSKWQNVYQKFKNYYNTYNIFQISHILLKIYIYKLKLKFQSKQSVEPSKNKPVEPSKNKPVEPAKNKPVEPSKNKPVEPAKNKPLEKKNKPKFTGKISILNQYKEWKKDCLGIDSSNAIQRCDLDDFKIEDNFNEKKKFEYNSSKPWFEYIENNRNI